MLWCCVFQWKKSAFNYNDAIDNKTLGMNHSGTMDMIVLCISAIQLSCMLTKISYNINVYKTFCDQLWVYHVKFICKHAILHFMYINKYSSKDHTTVTKPSTIRVLNINYLCKHAVFLYDFDINISHNHKLSYHHKYFFHKK